MQGELESMSTERNGDPEDGRQEGEGEVGARRSRMPLTATFPSPPFAKGCVVKLALTAVHCCSLQLGKGQTSLGDSQQLLEATLKSEIRNKYAWKK